MKYAILVAPLPQGDGGGYVGVVPDLPGCVSDGNSPEEAIRNTQLAIEEWIAGYTEIGREIPEPGHCGRQAAAMRREMEKRLAEAQVTAQDLERRLKETVERHNGIEDRMEALENEISELHEKADHLLEWFRFLDITGNGNDVTGADDPALLPARAC